MPATKVTRFASVHGHDAAIELLRSALSSECLAHSLLLSGPDGIGKRSLALAFAAWVYCTNRGDDSCGECAGCRQVAAQSHPDLRLVTIPSGKKEIGVEQARDLKRWITLRSAQGNTKIAILLDAEMLTLAAQNALLKTLEEPPAGSMLMVVANNADAMLATVRSRCQRIPLRPLAMPLVTQILVDEHQVSPAIAGDLARLAEGSPGRALALQEILGDAKVAEWMTELATHPSARYVRQAQMAAALMNPESAVTAKLELLLHRYRDQALEPTASPAFTRTLLQRAGAVTQALSALRRTNPNRQLLLEALLLQLMPGEDSKV